MNELVADAEAPTSAADDAYQKLRTALIHGRFPAGSRVTERLLASEFGLTRTPAREAVLRLQSDGLVETRGGSLVVRVVAPDEVADLYETRAVLEALAAELAATRSREGYISRVEHERLRKCVDDVHIASQKGDARASSLANLQLHKEIARLGGNKFVIAALNRLWNLIAVSSLSNLTDGAWADEVHGHHNRIVDAVVSGDSQAASDLMKKHICAASRVYAQHEREQA